MSRPRPLGRAGFVAAALLPVWLLAGCSDDAGDGGAASGDRDARTSTTSAPTSSASPSEPSIERCPLPDRPREAEGRPVVEGDFDGDGRADRFLVYVTDGGVARARIELDAGGGADTAVDGFGDPPAAVGALATRRFEGGATVGFGTIGLGASTEIVGAFVLDGCDVVRPPMPDGPDVVPVGATVMHLSGARCEPGDGDAERLVVVRAEAQGEGYTGTEVSYRLTDSAWRAVDERSLAVGPSDPSATALATFDC